MTAGPILGDAEVVWRDEAQANEDAVHAVINAGGLLDEDWYALEALATTNRTGGTFATTVPLTAFLPLVGLPDAVLRAIPYETLVKFELRRGDPVSPSSPRAP